MVSADAAACFVDLMKDRTDVDWMGIQAHMEEGMNGEIILERFDQLAKGLPNLRMWITEFDVNHDDPNERAEDIDDFMRLTDSTDNF